MIRCAYSSWKMKRCCKCSLRCFWKMPAILLSLCLLFDDRYCGGQSRRSQTSRLLIIHLADGPTGVTLGRQLVDAGIPVVFMTANARRIPEDFSGAIGVIGKPYTEAGVSDALKFLVQAIRNPPPSRPCRPA